MGRELNLKFDGAEAALKRRPRVVDEPREIGVTMKPGDQRGFVHKKLLGIGAGLLGNVPGIGTAFNVARTAVSALQSRGRAAPILRPRSRGFVPRTLTARVTAFSEAEKEQGKRLKFADLSQTFGSSAPPFIPDNRPCRDPGLVRAPDGHCVAVGSGHYQTHFGGGDGVAGPLGEAVMGRYGAAMQPGSMMIDRAVCGRKMHLGDDGLCYAKTAISNKQRMWPKGRRPLLSGGDMRAISIAATAAKRLERTTKRLQGMGMMKKPASRPRAHAHAREARGVVSV